MEDHLTFDTLAAGLDVIRQAPAESGLVNLIVRRPAVDVREVLSEGVLDLDVGLVGDTWKDRSSKSTADGTADPRAQITVTSWRAVNLLAGSVDRCPLAGDQLYVDLDLSYANLPAGTRLSLGSAVLEVSDKPHAGCAKFSERFGADALRFVNTGAGRDLRLRGINTRVVRAGTVRVGDQILVERV